MESKGYIRSQLQSLWLDRLSISGGLSRKCIAARFTICRRRRHQNLCQRPGSLETHRMADSIRIPDACPSVFQMMNSSLCASQRQGPVLKGEAVPPAVLRQTNLSRLQIPQNPNYVLRDHDVTQGAGEGGGGLLTTQ